MRCFIKVLAFLSVASAATTCHSISNLVGDSWCQTNCLNTPSYCPDSYCLCSNGTTGTATPTPTSASSSSVICQAISSAATDLWCTVSCNYKPVPVCPRDLCKCQSSLPNATLYQNSNCVAIHFGATDDWCNYNCPAYCPSAYCSCGPNITAGTPYQVTYVAKCITATNEWCQHTCSRTPTGADCLLCCAPASNATNATSTAVSPTYYSTCPTATNPWCQAVCSASSTDANCVACCALNITNNPAATPLPRYASICLTATDSWCTAICSQASSSDACQQCCVPVSATKTPTPSASVTPSASRTPSITPSITPSASRSPSITPTKSPSISPSITPTPVSGICFSGDSTVQRKNADNSVETVALIDLREGDQVSCVEDDGSYSFCTLFKFATIDLTENLRFNYLQTASISIASTEGHVVYVLNGVDPSQKFDKVPLTGVYENAVDVQVGDQLVVWNSGLEKFEIQTVTSNAHTFRNFALDPKVVGRNQQGSRIVVNNVFWSDNSNEICTGPEINNQNCFLREANAWQSYSSSAPSFGLPAVSIPAAVWGSTATSVVVHDPWTSRRVRLDRTMKKAGKTLNLGAFGTVIRGYLNAGVTITEDMVYNALSSSYA